MRLQLAAVAAAALALGASSAQAGVTEVNAGLDALRSWNTIVEGNLTTGPDTFGRAFVGGNLKGNATEFFLQPGASAKPGLVVVGNVEGGTVHLLNGGGATIGGNITGQGVEVQGGGTLLVDGTSTSVKGSSGATIYAGGAITNYNANGAATQIGGAGNPADGIEAGLATERDTMFSNLRELSGYLKGLGATDTPTIVQNSASFNITSTGSLAVFTLSSLDQLSSLNADPKFTVPSTVDTIIINVGGVNVTNGFNFNGNNALASKIIWNFWEAQTINFSRQMWGSILAPNAVASITSEITGTGVFKEFNQNAQMHTPGYGGTYRAPTPPPSTIVPEPATWALMIMGFGAVGGAMRRRRVALAA